LTGQTTDFFKNPRLLYRDRWHGFVFNFFEPTEIMPQTTAKKKFFNVNVSKNSQKNSQEVFQSLVITEFQQLQKNITGGKE